MDSRTRLKLTSVVEIIDVECLDLVNGYSASVFVAELSRHCFIPGNCLFATDHLFNAVKVYCDELVPLAIFCVNTALELRKLFQYQDRLFTEYYRGGKYWIDTGATYKMFVVVIVVYGVVQHLENMTLPFWHNVHGRSLRVFLKPRSFCHESDVSVRSGCSKDSALQKERGDVADEILAYVCPFDGAVQWCGKSTISRDFELWIMSLGCRS